MIGRGLVEGGAGERHGLWFKGRGTLSPERTDVAAP